MNKITLLACALMSCTLANAQRTPTHPLDIKDAEYSQLSYYFDQWSPGTQPQGVSQMDDEFYISRVKPRKRISELNYQASPDADPNRKMCIWVPLDDPTSKWKALPRYCFEGDNFSLWSYIDIHGNWTAPWMRVTAGLSDVAHKNGVKVGCVMSIPWNARVLLRGWGMGDHAKVLAKFAEKNRDGSFKNSLKLVKLMKYYGIDGLGVNSEFTSTPETMTTLIDFFADCHKKAKEIDWEFQLHWYDGTNESGSIRFDSGLGRHNERMFGDKDHVVTDMMFANYNWGRGTLTASERTANELGRSSYDYYAGFDIQGRALKNYSWSALKDSKISVGFWGAHSQSLIHQSATDDGTSDIAIQKAYLLKQELMFSGGNRNPAAHPEINTNSTLANASLKTFHGLAAFVTAKSTINEMPFVTRFNLGNGLSFRNEGKVTFNHKWYNLNTQDFMPTWRWWITDRNDQVNEYITRDLVKADLTFDDAYFGGSCLSLHGKTEFSRVKLFKTLLSVDGKDKISLTYKVMNGTESKAKVFVSLKDNVTDYKEIALPNAPKAGEWTTFEKELSALGINSSSQIAMIGLVVENTPENYDLHIGELAVRNPQKVHTPVQPTIKEKQIIRGLYNTVDFKLRYASKDESNGDKYYNEDVDTWYYEILYQQEGQEEMLLTTTASWAAYVVDAPIANIGNRKVHFGVRAVAPDGKTKSATSWTDYEEVEYNTPKTDVVIDKAVVKPNETFTLKFEDYLISPAREWKLINSATGNVVYSTTNATSITTSLDEVGTYDLRLIDSEGKVHITCGKVQITPTATGAVPQITDITADKTTVEAGKNVTYSATATDGSGRVSRGLVISDPNMFKMPADLQKGNSYTYALWVKADKFAHDKQGTNLISKNTIKDGWPHNNWGDLWVQIRPQWRDHMANEVSFNTMGWEDHDDPNSSVMTKDHPMSVGVWYHLAVTHNDNGVHEMFVNGKKVATGRQPVSTRRENRGAGKIKASEPADIFIGGGGVYKSGFNGSVDEIQIWNKPLSEEEVQRAMQGYKESEVPAELQGYFTFETMNADGTFPNLGKGGADKTGSLVQLVGSGGENTSTASYETQHSDNNVLGYPGIEGTLEVTPTYTWTLEGATTPNVEGATPTVTYTNAGKVGATLTLSNRWGEATFTKAELVEVTASTGINGVENGVAFEAFPNPFVESVNLRFAEGGTYTLNVLNANGVLVQSNLLTTAAGEVTNVSVTGAKGLYILQIVKNGKTYKTIKLVKK
ncbi:T9SS type A sorting domain-containing protein [Prevotella nanceiensis]|uniref:endo-beta-N-acetylglucosaminidase n=1 Tax=Hoylesella nanceiensis TaxID=425941 RepID=UPI001C5CCB16|nr:LamG-like jellyroll fold domain-containing protein [Hoylesella nanceiensis]MBW4766432.1 T9SS type A sorting domain-containing protein [Hoylesella nanceiensis]